MGNGGADHVQGGRDAMKNGGPMPVTEQCETGLLILPREVGTRVCEFFPMGWKRVIVIITASSFAAGLLVHHKPRDFADHFSSP
jgi:hypothetical protein